MGGGEERVRHGKSNMETYITICKINSEWEFAVWLRKLKQGLCVNLLLLLSRFSRVRLPATPGTAAYQAPPSMGFSRQEYWSGVPLPSPHSTSSNSYT